MPDFNPTALAATAAKLLTKFGESTTLRSFPAPSDPTTLTPWKPAARDPAYVDTPGVRVVFLAQQKQTESPLRYEDGTTQRVGDLRAYAGAGARFDLGSVVIRTDGSEWIVKSVNPLAPNGIVILYELWVTQ